MNKTDEELNQAEKMAKRHGVRMCDENGDTHGEELYCVGIDDIADIIREARAEQDHIADAGNMVAEPLQILPGGGAFPFVEVGYVGEFVAPTKSLPAGTPLCVAPVQPVKQEPVANQLQHKVEYWLNHYNRKSLADMELLRKDVSKFAESLCPIEPVKQKPIGYVIEDDQSYTGSMIYANKSCDEMLPVYIAPVFAKREWVDLTEGEIAKALCLDINQITASHLNISRAISTAFKEKNR